MYDFYQTGVKNNDNEKSMKEYFLQHSWLSPITKGSGSTLVGFALVSTSDFDLFYKIIAGILGLIIMGFSLANSIMDYKHKKLRKQSEKKHGYKKDSGD